MLRCRADDCHIIISTNYLHPTKNPVVISSRLRSWQVFEENLYLVKQIRSLHWCDLVFGVLEE
ncbi:hypothetical protein F4803DRAFT_541729 [Xylaria telfairii]|nr:hypothetical protein F4803DRAFT_541729 [Xylaria telfairii]